MSPFTRAIVTKALELARRRRGLTPPELAEAVGCSLRAAERNLRALVGDGVLVVEVPPRKGQRRGSWRNLYRFLRTR